MPSTAPTIVYDVVADYPAALGDRIRAGGYDNDNAPATYQRIWKYGSALYALVWDYNGDDTNGADPYYYKRCWSIERSTNGGSTWSHQDFANRPMGGDYGTSPYGEAAVQIGSKIWVFFDYGEHPESSPSVYGVQFDEIRAQAFDCVTNTWGTVITTGAPRMDTTNAALVMRNNYAVDACYRGSDEVIVFHGDTDETQAPQRPLYSVFNTSTETWTSTSTVVFTSSNSVEVPPANVVYDGTYVHFFAIAGAYGSGANAEKWHRALTGSTLGTVGDMFASWPGSFRSLSSNYQSFNGHVRVFGSELIFTMSAYLLASGSNQYRVLAFRAPTATAAPSWTIDDIGSTAWDAAYADWGQSGTPFMVENGGDLYVVAGGYGVLTYSPLDPRYEVYAQRYAGSGSWDAPASIWDHLTVYSDGYSGTYEQNSIFKVSAVGDLSGTGLSQQLGFIGTLDWAPGNKDTVRFWREPLACCCANYAY